MKITKLEYQKQDPNRVNVFIDEKFIAAIDVNDVVTLGLYKNQELSRDDLNKIIGQSEFGKLFNAALNFLSYRPRSEWEVRHKLKFQTKNLKLIDNVIERLKKIGQINDEEFAKWFVDQRQTFRPKSQKMMAYELRKFGVQEKIASEVKDTDLALRALKKFHGNTKEKAQRFLAARGFDWQTIEEVLK